MGPGQLGLQLSTWVAAPPAGLMGQLALRAEVPLSERLGALVFGGVVREPNGEVFPRDTVVAASWLAVLQDDLIVRLQPGLSIPTGGISQDLLFTPLSTSSVDPWISADAVYGAGWLVGLGTMARVPVYRGWDGRRQGPFASVDLRAARRTGVWIPSVGLSLARQAPSVPDDSFNTPDFADAAFTASAIVNIGERGSAGAQVRAPFWATQDSPRMLAGGAYLRWVVGKRKPANDEHDEA